MSSFVGESVTFGPGAIFTQNTEATADARIGRQFLCGVYAYLAHDGVIGDYVTLAPRATVNGNLHIGDFTYIGCNRGRSNHLLRSAQVPFPRSRELIPFAIVISPTLAPL